MKILGPSSQVTVVQSQKIGCVWKPCFVKFGHNLCFLSGLHVEL